MDAAFDSTPAMSETFAQPQTLLLLTNQELWPGIICSRHFRPEKVILLYGNTPAASKEAALRLQKFLLKSGLVEKCDLLELPDDDFVGIQQRLGSPSSAGIRRKPDRAYPAPRSPMAGYSEPSQRNPERSLKWGDGFSRYHLRQIVAAHSLTAPQILVTFPKLGRVYGRDWYQLSAEGILQRECLLECEPHGPAPSIGTMKELVKLGLQIIPGPDRVGRAHDLCGNLHLLMRLPGSPHGARVGPDARIHVQE